jgi:hypothetical protein
MAMIQATTPTTTATAQHLLNTEFISRLVRLAAMDPMVGLEIVKPVDLRAEYKQGCNSYTYRITTIAEMSGAAVVTENNAAPEAALTSSASNISGVRRALRSFVTDLINDLGVIQVDENTLQNILHGIRNLDHQNILALFTSLTNTQGTNAIVHSLANWDLVTLNFRAQLFDPGPLWAVQRTTTSRDLRSDLISNAAGLFAASWGDRAQQALQTTRPGMGVPWDGYTVYESLDVPVGDTTGWTNAVGVGGDLAAIEHPVWQELKPFAQRDESRFGGWLGASKISGYGIAKQANARAFITRT